MAQLTEPRVGWIGLGSMGLAMATNIQKYAIDKNDTNISYWNRTIERGEPLRVKGGNLCSSIGELTEHSDLIYISVSNDDALKGVVQEIVDSGHAKGKIVIDTTTVHPSASSSVTKTINAAEATYIAAPVFGATPLAQAGQLLMAVAGPAEAINKITPLLKGVVARNVIHVGEEPSKALLLKTTSNFITAGLMYLISEAHTLAEKSNLPASVLESLIEQNFGAYAHGVSKRLTSGSYCPAVGQAPSSGLELGIKDVGHGLSMAKEAGMELKLGELSMDAMLEAKKFAEEEGEGRKLDSSSVFGVVRKRAGLEFESEVVKERDGGGEERRKRARLD